MFWGRSSSGRALEWHSRGSRFDPDRLHHNNTKKMLKTRILIDYGFSAFLLLLTVKPHGLLFNCSLLNSVTA